MFSGDAPALLGAHLHRSEISAAATPIRKPGMKVIGWIALSLGVLALLAVCLLDLWWFGMPMGGSGPWMEVELAANRRTVAVGGIGLVAIGALMLWCASARLADGGRS